MIMVNTHEAKSRLSGLLAQVERDGQMVYICRGGKPVARLLPLEKSAGDPLSANPALKPLNIKGSLCEPLDEEDWPESWR
jgi:prevent-host-death family protein